MLTVGFGKDNDPRHRRPLDKIPSLDIPVTIVYMLRRDNLHELEETAKVILEHESIIIIKIFEKGNIKGISDKQLINFVESRLDICLKNLGYHSIFKPKWNPISTWFYKDVESPVLHDFFSSQGSDYNRNWIEGNFKW